MIEIFEEETIRYFRKWLYITAILWVVFFIPMSLIWLGFFIYEKIKERMEKKKHEDTPRM